MFHHHGDRNPYLQARHIEGPNAEKLILIWDWDHDYEPDGGECEEFIASWKRDEWHALYCGVFRRCECGRPIGTPLAGVGGVALEGDNIGGLSAQLIEEDMIAEAFGSLKKSA